MRSNCINVKVKLSNRVWFCWVGGEWRGWEGFLDVYE